MNTQETYTIDGKAFFAWIFQKKVPSVFLSDHLTMTVAHQPNGLSFRVVKGGAKECTAVQRITFLHSDGTTQDLGKPKEGKFVLGNQEMRPFLGIDALKNVSLTFLCGESNVVQEQEASSKSAGK